MSASKDIGTRAETGIVTYVRTLGFPHADRLALRGSADAGDIRLTAGLTAGIIIEVKAGAAAKNASDAQIQAWVQETDREQRQAGAEFGFLVTARNGYSPRRPGLWWVHTDLGTLQRLTSPAAWAMSDMHLEPFRVRLTLDHLLALLRLSGWGDPMTEPTEELAR
ncbi:hypothetical protein D3C74_270290 [compost metagenome]